MAERLYGPSKIVLASNYPWLPRDIAFASVREQLEDDRATELENTVLAGIL